MKVISSKTILLCLFLAGLAPFGQATEPCWVPEDPAVIAQIAEEFGGSQEHVDQLRAEAAEEAQEVLTKEIEALMQNLNHSDPTQQSLLGLKEQLKQLQDESAQINPKQILTTLEDLKTQFSSLSAQAKANTQKISAITLIVYLGLQLLASYAASVIAEYTTATIVALLVATFPAYAAIIVTFTPVILALGCYIIHQIAAHQVWCAQMQPGKRSGIFNWFWNSVDAISSLATFFLAQSFVMLIFQTPINSLFTSLGSTVAQQCAAYTPGIFQAAQCSTVAGTTASLGTSSILSPALSRFHAAASWVASRFKKENTPEQRKSCTQLGIKLPPPRELPGEPVAIFPDATGIIQSPAIALFLGNHGCNLDATWAYWLPQATQVQNYENGTWEQSLTNPLTEISDTIAQSFSCACSEEQATTITDTVIDFINQHMPMSAFYPEVQLLQIQAKANPTELFQRTVPKKPQAILEGLRDVVLSYFNPENLRARALVGDESIFNCPFTPVAYAVNGDNVTFYACPQARQDLLYPQQWQSAPTPPAWFSWLMPIISYAMFFYRAFTNNPKIYFAPDGSTCMGEGCLERAEKIKLIEAKMKILGFTFDTPPPGTDIKIFNEEKLESQYQLLMKEHQTNPQAQQAIKDAYDFLTSEENIFLNPTTPPTNIETAMTDEKARERLGITNTKLTKTEINSAYRQKIKWESVDTKCYKKDAESFKTCEEKQKELVVQITAARKYLLSKVAKLKN